ncbi:unnamed protein product [Withania somnifera]
MVFKTDEASSSSHVLKIPGEDAPFLGKNQQLSSPAKTFANIFMSLVGAGVLGLPYTFKRTGWVMGTLLIISVATLTYYCMMLLVYSRRKLESKSEPVKSHLLVIWDLLCVDPSVVFILVHSSITETNPKIMGFSHKSLGLNSIPTLTLLAPLSIFTEIVDLGASGVNRPSLEMFGGFSVFFYGLGVAVYAFEGMGMVLPLKSETRDKDKFGKILGLSMAFVAFLYGGFGALGYFAFGEETKDIVTINFGQGLLSSLVQFGLCIDLFLAIPLMMNIVYEVMERRFCEGRYCLWLRWLGVLALSFVALTVPNFADFMSLNGSSVSVVLGFVLPALFHLIVFKDVLSWCSLTLDAAFIVMETAFAVYGTSSSLIRIFSEMA